MQLEAEADGQYLKRKSGILMGCLLAFFFGFPGSPK
jgi:hypothetical protein